MFYFPIATGFLFLAVVKIYYSFSMDPITHGLVGATASQTFADKAKLRAAALTGFVSALIADLDVFIIKPGDPLFNLEIHRQFTHAFVFIPAGALVASLLVWWLVRKRLSFKETYLFAFAAYATAGLLDTVTSYGVQLFWPFTDERFALNLVAVFDPLFTLGILITAGIVFYKKQRTLSWLTWTWITLYLLFGYGQRERAEDLAHRIIAHQNHIERRMVVKPTLANQLLWSVKYEARDSLYAYGVRISPFSKSIIYRGESRPLLDWRREYAEFQGTTLYNDIARFSRMSSGYLVRHSAYDNVLGDGRYSMLPNTLDPLWGIRIDTAKPDGHVSFNTYRDADAEVRNKFLDMILGRRNR